MVAAISPRTPPPTGIFRCAAPSQFLPPDPRLEGGIARSGHAENIVGELIQFVFGRYPHGELNETA